jgi:hypothetical protein
MNAAVNMLYKYLCVCRLSTLESVSSGGAGSVVIQLLGELPSYFLWWSHQLPVPPVVHELQLHFLTTLAILGPLLFFSIPISTGV